MRRMRETMEREGMTTRQFILYLARMLARLAYAIGYQETGNDITTKTVEWEEGT